MNKKEAIAKAYEFVVEGLNCIDKSSCTRCTLANVGNKVNKCLAEEVMCCLTEQTYDWHFSMSCNAITIESFRSAVGGCLIKLILEE